MLIPAKIALGLSATIVMSTAYVFHEGLISVDVDEHRDGGSHIHFWVPATAVNAALQVAPRRHLREAAAHARPFLPAFREMAKELKKYPNAELVDVRDANTHVRVAIVDGKIQIDAVDSGETVHVRVPVDTLIDVADQLEDEAPSI